MFKKFAFGVAVAVALSASAYAQESEDGWALSFKRDAFDKTVFPEASIYETGSSISSSSNVSVACDLNGSLVPTFWPGDVYSRLTSYEVEFKSGSVERKFTFKAGDVPRLGDRLRLEAEDATALLDLFANASEPVAYRTENKQGQFTSIAARQAIDIVRTYCPK
ncbi:hypothetical protein STOPSMEL_31 [Sinorhizobium phage StopSmel]|nr:hypothetical protein STOPSMEL_31 [Sinorhizobium phage StopSmel]